MTWWRDPLGALFGRKDIEPWRSGVAFHDQDNFTTNRVTLANYADGSGNRTAVGHSATWACTGLVAGTLGSMSLGVTRKIDGRAVPQPKHPLHGLLHDDPNYDLTALDFWEYQAAAIELHGNAYALINRTGTRPASLEMIAPNKMSVTVGRSGELQYRWTDNGRAFERGQDEVLHIRGPFATRIGGMSTLTACAGVFDAASSAESAAASMFRRGAMPSGILSTEEKLTGEQRATVEQLLTEKFVGAMNAGRPMLLDNKLKWDGLTINPDDAQMLESRKFSGEDICRLFGVPPAMVGYGDAASNWGTGKEVDVLGFLKFNMRRRAKRIEKAVGKQLLTPAERAAGYDVAFNFEDLLRADSAGRAQFYNIMVRAGIMTRNEARAHEGLPPIAGGDIVTVQQQDVPIGSISQGNANVA